MRATRGGMLVELQYRPHDLSAKAEGMGTMNQITHLNNDMQTRPHDDAAAKNIMVQEPS